MFNKILKSKVFKNGMWLTLLQIVNTIIPLLTIPYITRVLGSSEYGIFSISLNWILYLQVLVEYGFGLTGARKVALIENNQNKLNNLFNSIISARIILLIISFVIMNIISLVSNFELKNYICLLLLFMMIFGTTFQLTWLFQGKQDMKFITIINVISRTISVLLIFLLVKNEKDIYLYCLLYSMTLFLSSMISMIVARKKYGLKYKFSNFKSICTEINDGKYLFASSAMTKIFSGFGITILGIFSTSSITGIYSAIYKIPYVLTMFFSPISQALFPYNSAKFKDGYINGKKNVKKIGMPIFCLFLFLSMIIITLHRQIVMVVFGSEYVNYSFIVIPLVFQFIFAVINNFLGIQILVASGNQKLYSKSFSIGCISIIILNIVFGKKFGIYGVSFAAMIGEIILTLSLLNSIIKIERNFKNEKN